MGEDRHRPPDTHRTSYSLGTGGSLSGVKKARRENDYTPQWRGAELSTGTVSPVIFGAAASTCTANSEPLC